MGGKLQRYSIESELVNSFLARNRFGTVEKRTTGLPANGHVCLTVMSLNDQLLLTWDPFAKCNT